MFLEPYIVKTVQTPKTIKFELYNTEKKQIFTFEELGTREYLTFCSIKQIYN